MVPRTGSRGVPVSNAQSQGAFFSGDLASGRHRSGGRSVTDERMGAQRRTERRLILGRVADQGRMWLSPRPRKAVVLGQEMHRSLQGAGVLHARSGPQGPSGVEATRRPATRLRHQPRQQLCQPSGAGAGFLLPQAFSL